MNSLNSLTKKDLKCCFDPKLHSKPVVVINRLSKQEIQKQNQQFVRKYILDVKVNRQSNEDITQTQQMQCLGLIPTKELASKPLESLSQTFPIRDIARIGPQLKDDSNRLLLNKRLIIRQNVQNMIIRKKMSQQNKERMRSVGFVSKFEMSSQISDRLVRTLELQSLDPNHAMNASVKQISLPSYEIRPKNYIKYNDWNSSNIERRSLKSELSFGLKGNEHKYVFTRRQRLDKIQRMESGINWKSRILLMNCRNVSINLDKIENCPICSEKLESTHSCRKSKSSKQSEGQLLHNSFEAIEPSLDLKEFLIESNISNDYYKDMDNKRKQMETSGEVKEKKLKSMDKNEWKPETIRRNKRRNAINTNE